SIHLSAGYVIHVRTDAERRRASAINATIPLILALFISFVVPLLYIYGERDSMTLAQSIVVLLLAICVLILIPSIRESEDLKERFLRGFQNTERDSFFFSMKSAFKRKNFRSTMLVVLLATLGSTLYYASGIYFMKDILGLPLSYAIYTSLAGFVALIIFIPFWSNVSRRYGHAKTFKLSLFLITLLYIPFLWVTTIWEAIIFNFIGGFIVGGYYIALGPVVADVYDECTISTGKHQEAMYAGIQTFFIRIAIIGQAIIFVIIHILTGYNPNPQAKQTSLAIWGIRLHMALIPSLCSFVAFLIILKYYDLIGDKQKTIKRQLKQMKL
ncbi:MAG: MFS transporter, partial [Promethearchaeota archaeon]